MDSKEFKDKINQFISVLSGTNTQWTSALTDIALNTKALAEDRITNDGLNSDGNQLGEYISESYVKRRTKANKDSSFVDLNFTGQMWRDIGVKKQSNEGGKVTITLGGLDKKDRGKVTTSDIIGFNDERYNTNILKPTKEEEKKIIRAIETKLQNIFNNIVR